MSKMQSTTNRDDNKENNQTLPKNLIEVMTTSWMKDFDSEAHRPTVVTFETRRTFTDGKDEEVQRDGEKVTNEIKLSGDS